MITATKTQEILDVNRLDLPDGSIKVFKIVSSDNSVYSLVHVPSMTTHVENSIGVIGFFEYEGQIYVSKSVAIIIQFIESTLHSTRKSIDDNIVNQFDVRCKSGFRNPAYFILLTDLLNLLKETREDDFGSYLTYFNSYITNPYFYKFFVYEIESLVVKSFIKDVMTPDYFETSNGNTDDFDTLESTKKNNSYKIDNYERDNQEFNSYVDDNIEMLTDDNEEEEFENIDEISEPKEGLSEKIKPSSDKIDEELESFIELMRPAYDMYAAKLNNYEKLEKKYNSLKEKTDATIKTLTGDLKSLVEERKQMSDDIVSYKLSIEALTEEVKSFKNRYSGVEIKKESTSIDEGELNELSELRKENEELKYTVSSLKRKMMAMIENS